MIWGLFPRFLGWHPYCSGAFRDFSDAKILRNPNDAKEVESWEVWLHTKYSHPSTNTHTHNFRIYWYDGLFWQKVGKCQMTRSFMSYLKWIISTLMNFLHQAEMDGFLCTFRIHPEQSILLDKFHHASPARISLILVKALFGGGSVYYSLSFLRGHMWLLTTRHDSPFESW